MDAEVRWVTVNLCWGQLQPRASGADAVLEEGAAASPVLGLRWVGLQLLHVKSWRFLRVGGLCALSAWFFSAFSLGRS